MKKALYCILLMLFSGNVGAQTLISPFFGALSVKPDSLPVFAIDTLDTEDRFVKVVLMSNNTWQYLEYERPSITDDDVTDDFWNNDKIHAYKYINPDTLPDRVDLCLADSAHPYCAPYVAKVRSKFMWRKRRPHKGVDLSLHIGDPVRAAFDGKVRVVMHTKQTGGYGNLIVLRHANGLETYYGHLQRQLVKENDIVRAGEVIGFGGSTGRSTGPHLHFETRYMGQPFDPERIFDFETGILRNTIFTVKKHYFSIYSHYGQTDEESIEASKRKMHKVRSGDTLGGIAHKYGTTVANICKLNNFTAKKTLRIGQQIIVR